MPNRSTVFRHQNSYIYGAVKTLWEEETEKLKEEVRSSPDGQVVAGDSRCDSMGHSAKYGCYSLMDTVRNKVLTLKLIQVS